MAQRKYDSTVARIAGNLLSGDTRAFTVTHYNTPVITVNEAIVEAAVATARAIVAEVERTEPKADEAS